jgi:hypothetical protein
MENNKKKTRKKRIITEREMEYAMLWANNRITVTELGRALGVTAGGAMPIMARAFKEMYRNHTFVMGNTLMQKIKNVIVNHYGLKRNRL